MKNNSFSRKGIGVIETIIYVAILAILFVLIVNTVLIMVKSLNSSRATKDINISAEAAMERMVREIRLADDINAAESVFDVNPGKLVLNTIDPITELATTAEFFLNGDILMVREGVASAQPLTSSKTKVVTLIFRQISASSNSKAVKIEAEIRGGEGTFQKSEKFYDTAILRRSY